MAWVFVRLKWRLLANAGATGREELLGWLSRAVGMFVAVTIAVDLATAPRHGGAGLVAVFVAIAVGWIMLPLLAGSDRALDVARLAVLPLTRRELVVGLFAASLVGAPPVATLVLLSGAVPAYAAGRAGTAIVVADVVVMAVLSIATGRAVSAGLAAAVHSRRGRDLASVVLAIVSAAGYIAWRLSTTLARQVDQLRPSRVTEALSWTPPGALARSIADAHSGGLLAAVGGLAYALAVLVAVGWLWARALERQLTNPAATSTGRSATAARAARAPRVRPRTPAAAVWLKDLRYLWRAPVQRANIVTAVVTAGFVTVPLLTGANRPSGLVPYVGAVVAFFLETNLSANLFGVDGAGFGAYLLTGADAGEVLRGKALAVTTLVGAIAAVVTLAGCAASGSWAELPSALLLTAGVITVAAGTGLVASVRSPFPVAMDTPTFGRTRRPRGRGRAGVAFFAFLIEFALIGVLIAMVSISRFALHLGTLPGAVAAALAGAGVAVVSLGAAARYLRSHLPEALLALSPRG
jgi:ABC-2 type transport system permease protein